jgi:membrane protease YdiL (CAAX protease family)
MAELPMRPRLANPKKVIVVYLLLVFALSSVFWYIIAAKPQFAADTGLLRYSGALLMWSPALAAVVTRLALQRNLDGFGLKAGELRWWLLAIVIPIAVGFVMFCTAWVSGTAPFLPDQAAAPFSAPLAFLTAFCFSVLLATGEEIGWRGLLVPELGRITTFTWVAAVSAFIWFCWHLPLMLAGVYGDGSGYSMVMFFLSLIGGSTLFAWIRLRSGCVWTAALLHGSWNYFIQTFYPAMTATTEAGNAMLGEFGWFAVLISIVIGLLFWHLRYLLPAMPKPEGGL